MSDDDKKAWTLEGACLLLPDVRERTERSVHEAERLQNEREALEPTSLQRRELEVRIQRVVEKWAKEMEALGVEVKGPWLIDFDNGSGYYCWKWPEESLSHFHGYDEGFEGRVSIQ